MSVVAMVGTPVAVAGMAGMAGLMVPVAVAVVG